MYDRQSQFRTERRTVENSYISREAKKQITDMHRYLSILISGDIPSYLGYGWEGCTGPSDRSGIVYFEDVLGRKLELPRLLC